MAERRFTSKAEVIEAQIRNEIGLGELNLGCLAFERGDESVTLQVREPASARQWQATVDLLCGNGHSAGRYSSGGSSDGGRH